MNVDPHAAVCASADERMQPEAKATDTPQTTDLPAQVLDIAVAAPVRCPSGRQRPLCRPVLALRRVPTRRRQPWGPRQSPAVAPALAAVRRDAVLPAARLPAAGLPVPDAASQDPARIAVATPGATPSGNRLCLPVSPPGLRAAPEARLRTADTEPRSANPAISVAPMASERVEGAARPSAQPVRLEVAAPVGSREFGADSGKPAGVDGDEQSPSGGAAHRPAAARTGRGTPVHRQRPGQLVDCFSARRGTRRHPGEPAAPAGHAAGTGDQRSATCRSARKASARGTRITRRSHRAGVRRETCAAQPGLSATPGRLRRAFCRCGPASA